GYAVVGGGAAGYTTTVGGDCAPDGGITLAAGGTYTCTVVHDDVPDVPASLTVVTRVINDDGGMATADQFTVTVSDASGVVSTFPGAADGTELVLGAGGYTVDGGSLAGYSSTIGGDCAADGTLTAAPGGEYTCTVVHNDVAVLAGALTVVTQVVNDDGGTAVPADFTVEVRAGGGTVAAGPGDAGGTRHELPPGDYVVAGGTLSGYTTVLTGDCAADGRVVLPPGAARSCLVTHDDIPGPTATLTVTTVVVNDHGGTATSGDFTVEVRDAAGVVGTGPGTGDGESRTVPVGTYTLDGGTRDGYTTAVSGDCAADGSLTLAAGDTAACTVTHDDVAAELTVRLTVVGAASLPGVLAVPEGFTLTVAGEPAPFDEPLELPAGTHAVVAGAPHGYTLAYGGACTADGMLTVGL